MLNPTIEYPSEHLTFHPDGSAFHLTSEGKTSISIFNLNSKRLYQLRGTVIHEVIECMEIKKRLKEFSQNPNALVGLRKIDDLILSKTLDSAPYAAAARAVVNNPPAFGL